jgi:protein-serine/threonine kinase
MSDPNAPRVSSRLSNSAKLSNSISRRVHREVRFGDYILGSTLGQGEFGKVKLGWRKDGKMPEQVAIKLIRKDTVPPKSSREIKVFREINALKLLTHPNIVRLEEVIQNDKYIGIVLEYASGGELFDHILTHKHLKDNAACRLFAQLISGVHYLHSKGIVHRDLKLENLLLDKHKNVIITDFGFANSFKAASDGSIHDLMSTSCGSPCYAAPELVVSDSKYVGRKVDVWSCGVILYAMLAGYLPFDDDPANPEGDNITQLYKYITTTPLTFPEYIQPMPRDLLRKILVSDPNRRIDLNNVRSHAWLAPHAHFLSVTPVEWDRSFLRQPTELKPPQPQPEQEHLPRRPLSYHPTTSQSAFDPPTQSVPPAPSTSVVSNIPVRIPQPVSAVPPSFAPPVIPRSITPGASSQRPHSMVMPTHGRHSSIQLGPETAASTSSSMAATPTYMSHSRRHSVQVNYTKGVTPSNKPCDVIQQQQRRPLSTASNSSDDVLAALDSETHDASLYSYGSYASSRNVITPIDETEDNIGEVLSKIAISKPANTSRLPPASRKPRPTSFQPYMMNYDDAKSATKPFNFHMPTTSEPRVGITPDTALPGEISRPSAFKASSIESKSIDTSKEVAPSLDGDSNSNIIANEQASSPLTPSSNSPQLPSNPGQVEIHKGPFTDDQGVPDFDLVVDNGGERKYPSFPKRSHTRNANSVSYGAADPQEFGRVMGYSPPKENIIPSTTIPGGNSAIYATNGQLPSPQAPVPVTSSSRHRQTKSMVAPPSIPAAYSEGTSSIGSNKSERKRFSFLGYFSGGNSNSNSHAMGSISSNTGRNRNVSQGSFGPAASIASGGDHVDERRVLEPPGPNSVNQRHYRTASYSQASHYSQHSQNSQMGISSAGAQKNEQSAARRVVEFFKRKSRVQN